MADPRPKPYQLESFPAPDQPFDTPELAARAALQSLLIESMRTRNEYGGMICELRGKYYVMKYNEGERNHVDVGKYKPNNGCLPEGSKAVAYYHTHPNYAGAGFPMEPDVFSKEDKEVAEGIDAYLGSISGLYLRYDHRSGNTYIAGPCLRNTTDRPDAGGCKAAIEANKYTYPPARPKALPPRTLQVAPAR